MDNQKNFLNLLYIMQYYDITKGILCQLETRSRKQTYNITLTNHMGVNFMNKKVKNILFIIIGLIGLVVTLIFLQKGSGSATSFGAMIKNIGIFFLPFVISFILISTGIKGLKK